MLDIYTTDFFTQDFSDPVPVKIDQDVWQSHIPFVEMVVQQSEILPQIHAILSHECFAPSLPCVDLPWWMSQSYQGWSDLGVKHSSDIVMNDLLKTEARPKNYAAWASKELCDLIDILLQNEGISLSTCCIKKLDPGGWLKPHRDMHNLDCDFAYVWMPLHAFEPGMKIWPWGMLDHRYGCYYLLNSKKHPHAVWNRGTTARFVLVGFVEIEHCTPIWKQRVKQAIDQQWSGAGL